MELPVELRKTILVVDDDPGILALVCAMLAESRFHVISATGGNDALLQAGGFAGDIDLLLSDFQMPEMSGIGLATQLTLKRPAVKVLLMSGFPGGMLILNEGWHFLAKPFIPSQLLALVNGLITPDLPTRFTATV